MSWQDTFALTRRSRTGQVIVAGVIGVLAAAFFRVQVLQSGRFQLQSDENRLRPVPIPAPRGLVIDRNGVVLAENVPGYSVALLAPSEDTLRGMLRRLGPILGLDAEATRRIAAQYRTAEWDPVVVRRDAPFEMVSALEEQRPWNPGLVIQSDPKRRYPLGATVAHALGYVAEITEEELRTGRYRGARPGTLVGRDGLEQYYDDRLRGRDGVKFVEVDALGRTVRDAGVGSMLDPQPGDTVRTTIDIALQQFVQEVFPPGRRGAVIALDPRNGEVLALFSAPSYDPNTFIGGVDPEAWRRLSQDPDFPLFNRAIQARYAPASPFKLAVAAMALRRRVVDIDTRMAIPCRGGLQFYNRYFRCWREEGHGDVTLAEAIQYSCDVYFYQLGLKLGLTTLLQDGMDLGFGERASIDLPNESRPVFPSSVEYYNRRYGPRGWTNAVTLNLAIGQGENAQTLVNMARFYAMLANPQGLSVQPHLVAGRSPEALPSGLSVQVLAEMREALVAVVDRGTAAGAQVADLRIAGKTGTAQNPHGPDHGWFLAFAPAEDPQIVVGAVIEFAEHGSSVAPLVTRIIARHLLGPESVAARSQAVQISVPEDSAPGAIPILPDTTHLRPPAGDTSRGTPPGAR